MVENKTSLCIENFPNYIKTQYLIYTQRNLENDQNIRIQWFDSQFCCLYFKTIVAVRTFVVAYICIFNLSSLQSNTSNILFNEFSGNFKHLTPNLQLGDFISPRADWL
jgi:hypothetical protein